MKIGKVISLIGALGFGALLVYGLATGTFISEGSILSSLLWGQISLIDVYIMFIIFSFWVIYREKSVWRSIIWVILIMILGSFITCLYIFITFMTSKGDWKKFWLGNRKDN
ncbi:MAG: DUF1475 domain-containing protein [Actinobacteria bacterium]|nr:DUF1475 domain-containing protein [Actinomycetota bacterium]